MDFRLSEENSMIADTLAQALGDCATTAQLRSLLPAPATGAFDLGRWQILADLGLCNMLVPERHGGLGLSNGAFCTVARECGAWLVPEPLVESSGTALPLLAELCAHGLVEAEELAPLVAGKGHAVFAHPDRPFTPFANTAAFIAQSTPEGRLCLGRLSDFNLVRQPSVDPFTPLFTISARPSARRIIASPKVQAAVERARKRALLFTAAQLAGIARATLQLTVRYARERQQFGKSIGANQAVKHMLADVEVELTFLTPVLEAAAELLERDGAACDRHLSNAVLRARKAAHLATRTGVQVHGAMGYSWECDVQLFLKRALLLRSFWGSSDQLAETVCERTQSITYDAFDLF